MMFSQMLTGIQRGIPASENVVQVTNFPISIKLISARQSLTRWPFALLGIKAPMSFKRLGYKKKNENNKKTRSIQRTQTPPRL